MNQVLFVTGTDTGVGKTLVTALIALKIRQMGRSCGVLKPFASGCEWQNGVLRSEDADFLQKTLDLADSTDEICPVRLEEPLSPLIAARRAGISTQNWPQTAREALETLRARHDWVVVEGAGGILAPLWDSDEKIGSNLDLINDWGVPAVVVTRRTLGTLNHTLLTLNSPLKAPAHFAGLVFNDASPIAADDVAAPTNVAYLAAVATVPIWGEVPFSPVWNAAKLAEVAATLQVRLGNTENAPKSRTRSVSE
ncbi:MAG TPA: dethiobiotin synthase, partial [Abditibacterium sp.]|jgi:dethiobiotin synthetase